MSERVREAKKRSSTARQAWQAIHDLVLFNPQTQARFHEVCAAGGFTPGQLKAVLTRSLAGRRPVPMRFLAREWRCDPSYVTAQIRELEQRGLVEREFNPADHRFKTVRLTDKGERVRRELLDRMYEPPAFLDVLSAGEQRTLRDLLLKLSAAAAAEAPACDNADSA